MIYTKGAYRLTILHGWELSLLHASQVLKDITSLGYFFLLAAASVNWCFFHVYRHEWLFFCEDAGITKLRFISSVCKEKELASKPSKKILCSVYYW